MLSGSALFSAEASVQNRASQPIVLLTLSHPRFETLRFVSDVKPVTSNGETFEAYPFGFELPGEGDTIPEARLIIQNVSKDIGRAIRQVKGPIEAHLAVALREEPSTIIADWPRLMLRDVSVNNAAVQGTLSARSYTNAAWPGITASPARTPGLHFT